MSTYKCQCSRDACSLPAVVYLHDQEGLCELAGQFTGELGRLLSSYFTARVKVIPATPTGTDHRGEPVCWMTLGKLGKEAVLLEADPWASFLIIEGMLGGRLAAVTTMNRAFTAIEINLLRQFAGLAGEAFSKSTQEGFPLFLPEPNAAQHPVTRADTGVILNFFILAGYARATFALHLPPQKAPPVASEQTSSSHEAEAGLEAVVSSGELSAQELSVLTPGALLVTEEGLDPEVRLELEGRALFKGKLRIHRGQKVIIITEKLADSLSESIKLDEPSQT